MWFFQICDNISNLSSLDNFEVLFIKKCRELSFELCSTALDKENSFLERIKSTFNERELKMVKQFPTTAYFRYKIIYLRKTFKSLNEEDLISMAIYLMDNVEMRNKILAFRKMSINDLIKFIYNIEISYSFQSKYN